MFFGSNKAMLLSRLELAEERLTHHEDKCENRWKINGDKLDQLHEKIIENRQLTFNQLSSISRLIYIATGIGVAVTFMGTDFGQRLFHVIIDQPSYSKSFHSDK